MNPLGYEVLLYYWFTTIEDPEGFADEHRELCTRLGLRGRILVAREGLNGTVSGTAEACAEYRLQVENDARFIGIEWKIDPVEDHVFKKLFVRVRDEIITLGIPTGPRTGTHLSPSEWREMLDDPDVVLVDGRNAYESELGAFRGALRPPVQNFREFPDWIEAHRDQLADKKILTYCTGGIRCEKLSAWMLDAGFENVFQLHGGIVNYAHDPATQGEDFEGVNVVFDERVVASAGPRSTITTTCRECGVVSANYVNCANVECNLRMIQCPDCEKKLGRSCSPECRIAPRRRQKGKKWHESRANTNTHSDPSAQ